MKGNLLDGPAHHPYPSLKNSDSSNLKKQVIVIAGPTATGKTGLSLKLARILDGEIVSADSIQVYRGMDIGTAKISLKERLEIPHHLIDILDLSDSFNVVQFYDIALWTCRDILARGHVPIVVGGTGFYLHALLYGPPKGPPAAPEIRQKLEQDVEKFGIESLYEQLCIYDLEYGKTINSHDRQKIIRALEIISLTGKRVSDFPNSRILSQSGIKFGEFDFRCWFIYLPTKTLFPRIEMRCDEMLNRGFIKEVEHLDAIGLRGNSSASQAIGYRQCLQFLDSSRSNKEWEDFVWEFKKASRRYAKRQFTWFRNEPLFHWINLNIYGYKEVVDIILQDYGSRY